MRALTAYDQRVELARRGGGKALHLHALVQRGCLVPVWVVLGTDVFDRFVESAGLSEEANAPDAGLEVNRRLSARIMEAPLEDDVVAVISEAYERVGGGAVAVRSSGAEEDALNHSFAGQFDSFLNVRGLEQVLAHVKRCWASTFAERATLYRRQHELSSHATTIAVIIQRLVRAEKSGVLFTVNPSNRNSHELVISSTYGLGESLVAGAVDADTIVLDRSTGRLLERHVGEKCERYMPSRDAPGCVAVRVPATEQSELSLTDREIAALARVGLEIEYAFGAPQDIEWAIEEGVLWILQSRPVTSLGEVNGEDTVSHEAPTGQLRVWDNSNIIESYGGITSPLTFTFARHVYHQVYRWYCKSLMVPECLLRDMDEWQANRLGYFNGRVYYNLLNWYRMQHLLPFAGMKRRMMELSMGVEEALSEELARDMRPLPHRSRVTEFAVRVVVSIVFTWRYFTSRRNVRQFLDRFGESFTRFDALDYESMSAEELYQQMLTLDRELLPSWGPMVALEAVILTSIGLLLGLTQRWLPDAPRWLYWNVGKPRGDVESAEPARRLHELVEMVLADPKLERIVRETEPDAVHRRLAANDKRDFLAAVDDYIVKYGYRSVNELKLEEPSMREDISVFFQLLRSSLSNPVRSVSRSEKRGEGQKQSEEPQDLENEPDDYLAKHMGRLRRPLYEVLRRKAQSSLAAREQVRFCRTRAFGLARRIFRALGKEMVHMGITEEQSDIFQLRLEELRGCFEGTISHEEIAPLIAMRKRQLLTYQRLTAPSRFLTRGPMYWNGNLERPSWQGDTLTPSADSHRWERRLHGLGCCPGQVEGEAKVLDAPLDVNGAVIVTYRTDPGWIAALPSAAALLVERGSPLTHVAIVARELNVPTIVQIKNLTREVKTGMGVGLNGSDGTVTILSESAQ